MSEPFDPYYTWLGIPPLQQPPNHYRLLGVELFEGNPDVIERAADRCMADLRTYQTGKHSAESQILLNEVAAARLCLLDPKKKAEYDASLREKQAADESQAVGPDVFSVSLDLAAIPSASAPHKAKGKPTAAMIGGVAVAGVAIVLVAAWAFLSGGKTPSEPRTAARDEQAEKQRPGDSAPKQPPTEEAEKSRTLDATTPSSEVPRKKAEEPSPPTGDQPQGEFPGIAAPAAEPVKKADQPVPPPTASQPAGAEPNPKPTEEGKKHPIPSAEIQRAVGGTIEETYKLSEARTPEAKLKLAKELAEAAAKSAKPDEQYVLLRKSVDLACDGGDAALMLETVGSMTDAFTIDPLTAKAAMLERFAKGPRSPVRVQSLLEGSRGVIDDAMAEDRYEIALTLAKTVGDACSRSTPQLRKEAADRRKRVQQLQKQFEAVQKALDALKTNPEDAEANLAVGSWYCFLKDDWKAGLAHLAKGSDAVLKALASRDLTSPPASPEEQVKLADAWWDAAADRRGDEKAAMLRSAGHWYEQALGRLEGINKTKVEKRLAQIAEVDQEPMRRSSREPPLAFAPFDAKRARKLQIMCARCLKVPVEETNSIGMRLILIPPGEFTMGSSDEEVNQLRQEGGCWWYMERLLYETPQHRVRISKPFYIGLYEVTQAEYRNIMRENPSACSKTGSYSSRVLGQDTDRFPVERIPWPKAKEFCEKLSSTLAEKHAGRSYRLPTEAEWEYACRAGTQTRYSWGDDPRAMDDFGWYGNDSGTGVSHWVGQKRPNAFGVFEMHGNILEWCADVVGADQFKTSLTIDPVGLTESDRHVCRGGGWQDKPCAARSAFRCVQPPACTDPELGFRVICIPETLASFGSPGHQDPKRPASTGGTRSSAGSRGFAPPPAVAPFSAQQARRHQERWAEYLKVPVDETNSIGMKLVLIPPGEFDMGSTQKEIERLLERAKQRKAPPWFFERLPYEAPQRRVRITAPFCLGAHEVTQANYQQVMGSNPSGGKESGSDAPVEMVS